MKSKVKMGQAELSEALSDFEIELNNGVKLKPNNKLRVLNSDKTKQLLCSGGLRVDDTSNWNNFPDGYALSVQTGHNAWEYVSIYPNKEQATEALMKVKKAMDENKEFLEL